MRSKLSAILLAVITLAACTGTPGTSVTPNITNSLPALPTENIVFTPWDVETAAAAAGTNAPMAYTVMLYMIGSDLESLSGAATEDLAEITQSGVDTERANVIILTGGAIEWQNNTVPEGECVLWRVDNDELIRVAGIGIADMGDPGTLSSFIEFSRRCYPSERDALILWDHGGGAIAGFGMDENWGGDGLMLSELTYALKSAGADTRKLELLVFDACLMANVETAVLSAPYAKYLLASESTEPEQGLNYSFLSALNFDPAGSVLGSEAAHSYMSYYGTDYEDSLTISVTELAMAGAVLDAMGELMSICTSELTDAKGFSRIAERRANTKSFGAGSLDDLDSDMVDVGDMAAKLADRHPEEASAVQNALNRAVIINLNNAEIPLGGLSAFYIYDNLDGIGAAMDIYRGLGLNRNYTRFIETFANHLTSENKPEDSSPKEKLLVDGVTYDLREVGRWRGGRHLALPIRVNEKNADMIVTVSDDHPDGVVSGYRPEEGRTLRKGLVEFLPGDRVEYRQNTGS